MNLIETVMEQFSCDEEQAARGLGSLFLAIRMAVDMRTFSEIATAFPESGAWMLKAPFQGGGTGEMLAMATPGAVRRIVTIAGFEKARVDELCAVVGTALKDTISPNAYTMLSDNLSLFR